MCCISRSIFEYRTVLHFPRIETLRERLGEKKKKKKRNEQYDLDIGREKRYRMETCDRNVRSTFSLLPIYNCDINHW